MCLVTLLAVRGIELAKCAANPTQAANVSVHILVKAVRAGCQAGRVRSQQEGLSWASDRVAHLAVRGVVRAN